MINEQIVTCQSIIYLKTIIRNVKKITQIIHSTQIIRYDKILLHIYIYMCVCVCVCVSVFVCVYRYVCVCVCVCTYVYYLNIHLYIYIYTYSPMCMYLQIQIIFSIIPETPNFRYSSTTKILPIVLSKVWTPATGLCHPRVNRITR